MSEKETVNVNEVVYCGNKSCPDCGVKDLICMRFEGECSEYVKSEISFGEI